MPWNRSPESRSPHSFLASTRVSTQLSPCRRLFVTQPGLEPILRQRAERAGAQVADGLEVINVEQDNDSVTVLAKDVESGRERPFTGQYLIGADGAHSKVRELMNIPFDGRGVFSNSITIYFHADLARFMVGRTWSVIYVVNPTLTGFLSTRQGFAVWLLCRPHDRRHIEAGSQQRRCGCQRGKA